MEEKSERGVRAAKLGPLSPGCKVELAVPLVAHWRSELFLPFAEPLDPCLANIEMGHGGHERLLDALTFSSIYCTPEEVLGCGQRNSRPKELGRDLRTFERGRCNVLGFVLKTVKNRPKTVQKPFPKKRVEASHNS